MNTRVESTPQFAITDVKLAEEWDHRAALVSICIGPVTIRGIQIWRNPSSGRLKVYFPSYERIRRLYDEVIEVGADLRTDIEAAAIAAYKEARRQAVPKSANGGDQ